MVKLQCEEIQCIETMSRIFLSLSPLSRMTVRSPTRTKKALTYALVGFSALYLGCKDTSTCSNDDPVTANTGTKEANLKNKAGNSNGDEEKDPEKNPVVDVLVDFISRLGFSGIMGVCTGYAAKRLSHDLMFVGGLVFGTAQVFAYCG